MIFNLLGFRFNIQRKSKVELSLFRCSFCDTSQMNTWKLIAGHGGTSTICDQCIGLCNQVLAEDPKPEG